VGGGEAVSIFQSWLKQSEEEIEEFEHIFAEAARIAKEKAEAGGRMAQTITERLERSAVNARKAIIDKWRADKEGLRNIQDGKSDSKAGLPSCTQGVKLFSRECGHNQAVVMRCGRPVCPECEKIRAAESMAKWKPIMDAMRWPKMLVLAVKSDKNLIVAMALLFLCFARFLDLRIGARARARQRSAALDFVREHAAEFDKHHAEDPGRKSAAEWEKSVIQFFDRDLLNFEKGFKDRLKKAESVVLVLEGQVRKGDGRQDGEYVAIVNDYVKASKRLVAIQKDFERIQRDGLKIRDLLYGFRSLEVTHGEAGWHPHFHCCVDSMFLPFPAVVTWWMEASTIRGECFAAIGDPDEEKAEGDVVGRTAHISAIRDIKEVIKYVTKHQNYAHDGTSELKGDELRELEAVLFRRKRVWPIGDCKPAELPKAPCPGCGTVGCKCQDRGTLTSYCAGDIWRGPGEYTRIRRDEKRGLMWEAMPVSAEASFSSHLGGSLTEAGQQMPLMAGAGP
jgi:hypothetical protein